MKLTPHPDHMEIVPENGLDKELRLNEIFKEHYGIPAQSLQNAPSHAVMMLVVSTLLEANGCEEDEVLWKELRRRAVNEINKENPQ